MIFDTRTMKQVLHDIVTRDGNRLTVALTYEGKQIIELYEVA